MISYGGNECRLELSAAELRDKILELQEALGEYTQQEQELREQLRLAVRKEGRELSSRGWQRIPCQQMKSWVLCDCEKRDRRRTTGWSQRIFQNGDVK